MSEQITITPNEQTVTIRESENKWTAITFVCFTVIVILLAWFVYADNRDIHHRLDVRQAYFNKGLIDSAKIAQEAYRKERKQLLEILEHCRNNPCNLPPALSVPQPEAGFKSVETILIEKEKE